MNNKIMVKPSPLDTCLPLLANMKRSTEDSPKTMISM